MFIEGTIEEIIFRNEENGYTVAILDYNNTPVTIVGKMIEVKVGEILSLEGEYVNNSKYGYQFSFTTYEIIMPKTLAGIEKFLASGLIYGVGPVTAKNLVNYFKEDTLSIMEFNPERLAEVKGISAKKAVEIGAKFNDVKKIQNIVIFLQGYNITTNLSLKIYDTYGDKTIDIVKKNPYKLVEDIDGVGFLTADKIAKNIGIPTTSEFRLRAGILYTLKNSIEKNGNTYLPKKMLLDQTSKIIDVDIDVYTEFYDNAFNSLILDRTCTSFWHNNVEIVTLSKYYFYETSIAQKLCLLNASAKNTQFNLDNEIKFFEQVNNIVFHDEQKNAIISAINNGVSVITGGPGTGKTTIVKCIIEILKQQQKDVLLLAPTGRAAKRLSDSTNEDAKTIHRALEVNNFDNSKSRFAHDENNPLKANCVIVDEVSMVDVPLMSSLLKALPRDCKLILVGDKDQLPSVGAGNVLADILKSDIIKVSMLTKIYRQSDNSLIITNAHLINNGKMPVIDNTSLDFFFEEKSDLSDIKQSIINLITKRLPNYAKIAPAQIQVLAALKAGICGIDNLNKILQEELNPPAMKKMEIVVGNTILRVGDKVMQTSNNYDLTWKRYNGMLVEEGEGVFNGDIGQIESIDFQTGEVLVVFEDGRNCTYPRSELNDISLAYAITIHKSQGSEFDIVVIPVIAGPSIILTRNLIYTAVTRAKKMVVLVGEKQNLRRMISNKYTATRFTLLKDLLVETNEKIKNLFS